MKKYIRLLSIVLFIALATQLAHAQDLITAAEAKKLVNSKDAVIVSTRNAADYARVHIRNAVNMPVAGLCTEGAIEGLLKSPAEMAKILGERGILPDKKIVIYDSGAGNTSGRLYWTLKYLGFEDVKILDGQMGSWRGVRGPVTNVATKTTAGTFTPQVNSAIICDKAYVKSKIGSAALVDVRSADEFAGGHIDGAKNLEFKLIMNEDGTLKSKEDIARLFTDAGIPSNKEVILYCQTSVRAGIVFMALTTMLDYPNVKVYDGAYNEWIAN